MLMRTIFRPARALLAAACLGAAVAALTVPARAQAPAPAAARAPIAPDFFGMHVRFTEVPAPGRKAVSAWPWIPVGSLRVWNTYVAWYDIEPKKGAFDFARLDDLVQRATQKGSSVVITLGRTPTWASARPDEPCGQTKGCAAEPRDLADWDDYVRAVVQRYKGRVDAYEIWNEPGFSDNEPVLKPNGAAKQYFTGSAATMAELAKRASQIIRATDPKARVVSPAVTSEANGVKRLDAFLKAGGGKWVDVIGYHFYITYPEDVVPEWQHLREALARHDLAKLPIWDTETGYVIDYNSHAGPDEIPPRKGWAEPLPERVAGMYVARSLILQAAYGIDRVYWFNWDHDLPEGPMGLSHGGGELNAAGQAWVKTRGWLLGAVPQRCNRAPSGLWKCEFTRQGRPLMLAWREHGTEVMDVGVRATAETLFGQPQAAQGSLSVGQEPVLLTDMH
jgi:hypothetical protein